MSSTVVPHAFMRSLRGKLDEQEGFTLIEILVVIIIIGILAAVATPIFLNQQRTARDSATVADVRNMATNTETGLVADPTASEFALYEDEQQDDALAPSETENLETLYLQSGTASRIEVSKTEGTQIDIEPGETPGAYVIMGWNDDGREYTKESPLVYESSRGGIVKDSEWVSTEEDSPESEGVFIGFEDGDSGWGHSTYSPIVLDNTESHSGNNSLKVTPAANRIAHSQAGRSDHFIEVESGKSYKISLWVKVEGTADLKEDSFRFGLSREGRGAAGGFRALPEAGTGWTYMERTLQIFGSGPHSPAFSLNWYDADAENLTVWIDDITVTKVE